MCEFCQGRGGAMIGGRWRPCRCMKPSKAAAAAVRRGHEIATGQGRLELVSTTSTREGGETTMANATRERQNGNGRKRRSDYEEDSGWGSLFQRERDSDRQPGFTGQLTLSEDELKQFYKLAKESGGEVELDAAVWVLPWKKDGQKKRRLRLHVQAPYEDPDADDEDELDADDDDDGDYIPF